MIDRRVWTRRQSPLRRLILVVLCVLTLALAKGCGGGSGGGEPPPGGGRVLSVPLVTQQTQVWCWAAAAEMLFRYHGMGYTQCEVLSFLFQFNCCGFPNACAITATVPQIQQTLFAFGGLSSRVVGPLSLQGVRAEIDANRPFIVTYQGSFVGHVVVIYGYDDEGNVYIRDPFYGSFVVPYAAAFTYLGQGQQVWRQTILASP